jgi:hypothetical protein
LDKADAAARPAEPRARPFPSPREGVATTSPWRKLSVNGTVAFAGLTSDTADAKTLCLTASNEVVANAGSTCITSSARFKTDIEPLATSSGLAEVLALRPVSFEYKPEIGVAGEQVGFIAEDIRALDERLAVLDAEGRPFTVRYENLTAILAKAIQEIAAVSGAFKANLTNFLGSSTNGISQFFAGTITALTEIRSPKLCLTDGPDDPSPVCVTKTQLSALLRQSVGTNSPASVPSTANGDSPVSVTATAAASPASVTSAASGDSPVSDASAGQSSSESVTSPAPPGAPSCTLGVSPRTVAAGQHATISWSTTNADTFSIDQNIGAVSPAVNGTTTTKAIIADTTFTGTVTSHRARSRAAPPPYPSRALSRQRSRTRQARQQRLSSGPIRRATRPRPHQQDRIPTRSTRQPRRRRRARRHRSPGKKTTTKDIRRA